MENFDFNYLDEVLEKSFKVGGVCILGAKGDTQYESDYMWVYKKLKDNDFRRDKYFFNNESERKKESHKKLNLRVLLFDRRTYSLDWNSTYKNSRGVYAKRGGKKIYIDIDNISDILVERLILGGLSE